MLPKHIGNLSIEIVLNQKSLNCNICNGRNGDAKATNQNSKYALSLNALVMHPKHVGHLSSEIVLSQEFGVKVLGCGLWAVGPIG